MKYTIEVTRAENGWLIRSGGLSFVHEGDGKELHEKIAGLIVSQRLEGQDEILEQAQKIITAKPAAAAKKVKAPWDI